MTIKRTINGEEISIELTHDELVNAYREQQGIYDREDVESNIDDEELYLNFKNLDLELTEGEKTDLRTRITKTYRHYLDNDGNWYDILICAARDVCEDWEKEPH